MKAGHSQPAFEPEGLLFRPARDVETAAPRAGRLGGERGEQGREKLITHRNPFRTRDISLVKRLRRTLTQAENSAAAPEPSDVDPFRLSIDAPNQSSIRRIILRVNRSSGAKRNKITIVHVGIWATILKIDIHLGDEVVFCFRGLREEKLLPNRNLLGRGALELHCGIRLMRRNEFGKRGRRRLLSDRADRRAFGRIQDNALAFFRDMIEQDGLFDSAAAIR